MEVYRIAQELYAEDLSGNGAKLFGGRWNSEGIAALYTSSSRALALLETLAHTPVKILQGKIYILVTIEIPDTIASVEISVEKLLPGWDTTDINRYTQITGDQFLKNNSEMVFSVPSIVVPEESNYVLNPLHPAFKKIEISRRRAIQFDKRVKESM